MTAPGDGAEVPDVPEVPAVPDVPDVPDVTVVIPVYNTVAYLPACLDSLIEQTIRHGDGEHRLEVVAVDDGSTDGSGELLDEYASSYPGVVRVLHQANSGGPAGPCNAGLDVARGRFVLFVGSDDYLALDGLERLVRAADEWDADVVVPPMVGVNGRYVDQRLFARDDPDMAFPQSWLPFSLGNTKLFRRSLVEEHGLRYALDLSVGSDQPFTIAAMLAARRVSVLARPHIYFAVRREAADNISYRTTWRARLSAVVAVIEHICALVPPGADRDAIVRRHFSWELAKILVRNLPDCEPAERDALVAELGAVAKAYLTPGVADRLTVINRLRWWHLRHGDVEALLELGEDVEPTVLAEGEDLFLVLPGFRAGVPDEMFAPRADRVDRVLQRALGEQRVLITDGVLRASAEATGLAPPTVAAMALVLVPTRKGSGPPRTTTSPAEPALSVPVRLDAAGAATVSVPLGDLARHPGRWAPRWRLAVGEHVYDVPVRSERELTSSVRRRLRTTTVTVVPGTKDRVVVEVRS